jgi:hypothetical protein
LHPNLARLAAAYDEIFTRWSRGQIDAAIARQEIAALVARDDDGILWSIDPESGEWLRRTITGELVPGTPPTYGLATPTPHDLSHNTAAFNPDTSIHMQPVEDELLYAPSTLAGSTRRPRIDAAPPRQKMPVWQIVVIVIGLVAAAWYLRGAVGSEPAPTAPGAPVVQQ